MELAQKYREFKTGNKTVAKLYSSYDYIFDNLQLNRKDIVIDFACGSGDIIEKYLAPNVEKVYGVDISPQMIQLAQESNPPSNVEYILGDFIALDKRVWNDYEDPILADKFICMFGINYFEDYRGFLLRAHNLLKENGVIGITMPLFLDQVLVADIFFGEKWAGYMRAGTGRLSEWVYNFKKGCLLPDFRKPLETCGFQILNYSQETFKIEFERIEDFCATLIQWDPLFTLIPRRRRQEFLDDLKCHALSKMDDVSLVVDESGKASYDHHVVRIIAQKL